MKWLKFLSAAGMLLAVGCIDIDYVGQSLAPLPSDQLVKFYNQDEDYSSLSYTPLGRATVTAPDGTSMVDIKEDLQDKAREVGAGAVKILSFRRVNTGTAYITKVADDDALQSYDTANQSRAVGGNPIYTDTFGQTGQLTRTAEPRYDVVLDVLFLADIGTFDAAMKERKKLREDNFNDEALPLDPAVNIEE